MPMLEVTEVGEQLVQPSVHALQKLSRFRIVRAQELILQLRQDVQARYGAIAPHVAQLQRLLVKLLQGRGALLHRRGGLLYLPDVSLQRRDLVEVLLPEEERQHRHPGHEDDREGDPVPQEALQEEGEHAQHRCGNGEDVLPREARHPHDAQLEVHGVPGAGGGVVGHLPPEQVPALDAAAAAPELHPPPRAVAPLLVLVAVKGALQILNASGRRPDEVHADGAQVRQRRRGDLPDAFAFLKLGLRDDGQRLLPRLETALPEHRHPFQHKLPELLQRQIPHLRVGRVGHQVLRVVAHGLQEALELPLLVVERLLGEVCCGSRNPTEHAFGLADGLPVLLRQRIPALAHLRRQHALLRAARRHGLEDAKGEHDEE
mmetsp:Transcript_22571/g.67775  ORF Transcript_22571/g.67775 Transcript_22571/m.67775 type:complete len:374 (-) Transcript_22571:308-1429(-)